jgi:PAS domain S-box-containing protein
MFSPGTSSRWAAPLRGILIGVGFFLVGSLSDIWLHQHFAKLSIELMVDALVGIGAGLLAFVYDRRQRRNLTQREQAMNALRESEERFRLVANSAPVLIWMSGPDKLCTFFNQSWLDFTGRSIEQELGRGWASGVHPDDLEKCLGTYSAAFDSRVQFEIEYRLRRFDGKYRWIVDYGVPRSEWNGTFLGYIGSCLDITDRKLSEDALLDLSGRLIAAHEEERARIARELHDDLSQRMALLEIGLAEFEQETCGLTSIARQRVHNIAEIATEVSSDIHNLSHKLHPSKLDSLGLVTAVAGFCKEFSKQHALHVQFNHHHADGRFPKDVTLCLFRIVQEALRNVVKHSGAAEARVKLSGCGDEIELTVSDFGSGFDTETNKRMVGIGFISMRERVRLVGGHLSIESEPSHGTQIRVRVPLTPKMKSARIGG